MHKGLLHQGFMTGQLLVAMPHMRDARFTRTVIYLCAHTSDGAMGLVLNRLVGALTFPDLLSQLGIDPVPDAEHIRIRSGGPVETGRGFVLHSADYVEDATLKVGSEIGLTATLDILRDIAAGQGPRRSVLALGYAGWGPGQLDAEMQANAWLNVPADEELIFDDDLNEKWERCIGKLGVNISALSGDIGHA
ncbi:YqgE/AlgH family protein [Dongia sp.]|uniref:YqgE/AlgH family protein n=1 Tax=Dongia sp. TaxID=1977262 RepID=UPI0035AFC8D2